MNRRTGFTASPKNGWSVASMALMALSAAARLAYYGQAGLTGFEWWVYLAIPGAASLLFPVFVLLWGRKTLLPTCLPVLGGVFYFLVKAFAFPSLVHTVLCCLLYLAVLGLYTLTVAGVIPTKKLLIPLFGLPLAYHLLVEDMQTYVRTDPPADFWTWLPEISVLCIMAALLCISIAMKKGGGSGVPSNK